MSLANIFQIICGKFHQNRPICMGCRDDTHRQTHTQTHTHTHTRTHTQTPSVRSQHIQSKFDVMQKWLPGRHRSPNLKKTLVNICPKPTIQSRESKCKSDKVF